MCACAGAQREQSRQANRQAHRVPVRSGARWSVSGNDTWQQLGGCALAVLYIHVTPDKSQQLLSRRNQCRCYRVLHTGQVEEDENTSFRLSVLVPPMLTEQTSRDSCDGHWLGRGEGANLVNARGGSKDAWHHLIWTWKMKPGCLSFGCVTAKGKGKSHSV